MIETMVKGNITVGAWDQNDAMVRIGNWMRTICDKQLVRIIPVFEANKIVCYCDTCDCSISFVW